MTTREQTEALLAVVDEYRTRECRRLLQEAQQEARALARQAHTEARRRVHQAVVGERERAINRIQTAQAELQTTRRRHQQRVTLALLEVGWERLEAELLACWQDPQIRKLWVDTVVQQALRQLPAGRWCLVHPQLWSMKERLALEERLAVSLGQPPELIPRATVGAGLRIIYDVTSLDGTLEGLLSDRRGVEARLLALLSEVETP